VSNLAAASHGISRGNSKFSRASLFLVQDKGQAAFMTVCTMSNKDGIKYKLLNNVVKLFERAAGEGKVTVRLKTPSIDILVRKANPVELKLTILSIKSAAVGIDITRNGVTSDSSIPVKSKDLEKPKTAMSLLSPKDYRKAWPIPGSLEKLEIFNCSLLTVNSRVLNLKNLTHLNLNDNKISSLPAELKNFQCLKHFKAKNNKIKRINESLFMPPSSFMNSVEVLDFSGNSLSFLPKSLSNAKRLVEINVGSNKLLDLDLDFTTFRSLRSFIASNNMINCIPYCLTQLKLETLNLCSNPLSHQVSNYTNIRTTSLQVPSLQELSAKVVRNKKVASGSLHYFLKYYLQRAYRCGCGKLTFSRLWPLEFFLTTNAIKAQSHHVDRNSLPISIFACCYKCHYRMRRKFLYINS